MNVTHMQKFAAELIGTAWLVIGGCGTAIYATSASPSNVGAFGVAIAFGLTVVTMAYAIGSVSGCHLNPAVTLGLCVAGRHPVRELVPYWLAQFIGGIMGAALLYFIGKGKPEFDFLGAGFAANGYGEHSPAGYSVVSALIAEILATAFFLIVIIGSTRKSAPTGFAGLAIGLCLTLIHLVTIPITNTSVNPARSLGPALFVGGWAMGQVWLFIIAPLVGAAIGGFLSHLLYPTQD